MPLTTEDLQGLAEALKSISTASSDTKASTTSTTAAVAVKLPTFWQDEPTIWFTQAESMFATKGITADKTMYDYVVAALDNKAALEIKSTLVSPPKTDMYKAIKGALIDAFDKTQEAKDAELLSLTDIGDRLPSSHYRYLKSLNSDGKTLLRALFLSHLPADVRTIVQAQGITDNEQLAKAADRAIQARESSRQPLSATAIRTRKRDQRGARSTRDRENTSTRSTDREGAYTCYYHKRFGKDARRCQPDCKYASQFNAAAANLVLDGAGNEQTDRL